MFWLSASCSMTIRSDWFVLNFVYNSLRFLNYFILLAVVLLQRDYLCGNNLLSTLNFYKESILKGMDIPLK